MGRPGRALGLERSKPMALPWAESSLSLRDVPFDGPGSHPQMPQISADFYGFYSSAKFHKSPDNGLMPPLSFFWMICEGYPLLESSRIV